MESAATVFVVDDDAAISSGVCRIAADLGFDCQCFESGHSFARSISSRIPRHGCIVLDLRLPDMDGLELLRMISETVRLPVVMISGHGDVQEVVRAMQLGAVTFLEKPFDPRELVQAIVKSVESSQENRPGPETVCRACALNDLSDEERTILRETVRGRTTREIAERLDISQRTVQLRRARLMRKLGADKKSELIDQVLAIDPTFLTEPR